MRSAFLFGCLFIFGCVGDAPIGSDSGMDAAGDTTTQPDGAMPMDGSMDVLGDGPVTKTWCDTTGGTFVFCEDFDKGMPKLGWTNMFNNGGNAAVGTTPHNSPSYALRSILPMVPSQMMYSARIHRTETTGANATRWTLEADVYLDIANAGGTPTTAPIALAMVTSGTEGPLLQLRPWMQTAFFAGYGTVIGGGPGDIAFAPKTWHHVIMEVNRNNNLFDVSCTIGAAIKSSTGLSGNMSSVTGIYAGLQNLGPVGGMEVVYDNIVLRSQ